MGIFEAFYLSPTQHPIMLWIAALTAIAFVAKLQGVDPSVRRYCGVLALLSILDAWMSSAHIYGIGSLSGMAASLVPLFFVLAGDFRYLLLAASGTSDRKIEITGHTLAVALGLTLIVPIFTQIVLALLPDPYNSPRVMFLIYEVSFVALTLALIRKMENVRNVGWVRGVSRYVIIYYSLWAFADAVILGLGLDVGYAIRVVPNILYYGGLIAVIGHLALRTEDREQPV